MPDVEQGRKVARKPGIPALSSQKAPETITSIQGRDGEGNTTL